MNEAHEVCGSDEWRQMIRDVILPWAIGDEQLGDDVLEVGSGYGATTDVLSTAVAHLTCVELDAELAAMLVDRFADTPSVQIVNADATSLDYPDGRFTAGDTYNPIDPKTLPERFTSAGFVDVAVRTNEFGWPATAHKG